MGGAAGQPAAVRAVVNLSNMLKKEDLLTLMQYVNILFISPHQKNVLVCICSCYFLTGFFV